MTPIAILAALLERVAQELDGTLDGRVHDDLRRAKALAAGLDPYLARCTSPESPALAALAGRTRTHDFGATADGGAPGGLEAEMLSGHVEGQLLKLLVRISGASRALDIGTFTGYSALAMAEAMGPEGRVVACEVDPGVADIAQRAFDASPAGRRISLHIGPALDTLHRLADAGERFDLAFIDADKGGYVSYLAALLDRGLIGPGGLICADNTLLQGTPYLAPDPGSPGAAIADFNLAVAGDARVEQVLLPLRDGVSLIRVLEGQP
ncbi:MAG: class I SAM-dependent methyltransferase [Nitriliruptoraceae bacterium]|nr:class I SAM-dependent methyltransferase [Nitriliruptoraceae bacterium]